MLAAGLLLAGCGGDPSGAPLRSDDELIAVFERERASFDSLATMLEEDRDIEMLSDYANWVQIRGARYVFSRGGDALPPGLSAERWDTYERLLRRVDTGRNIWNHADGVLFQQYVAKFGPEDSRWMRGYWYARVPPRPGSVTNDDLLGEYTYSARAPGSRMLYRPIEGPWYLYSHKGYQD